MNVGNFSIDDNVLLKLVRKYHLVEISLFGSVLRDDFHDESDIDFLLTFDEKAEIGLLDLVDLKLELEELTGRNVDVVEKRALKNPYRKLEILNTARILYAA
jgi:uncharacterized protein